MNHPAANRHKKKHARRKIRWGRVIFILLLPFFALSYLGISTYARYYPDIPAAALPAEEKFQDIPVAENQINILLVGLNNEMADNGNDLLEHAEAIIVAGINTDTKTLNLLSIPRDTITHEKGAKEKISSAYSLGGERLTQRVVEDFLQLPVHHYVAMDCQTFAEIIDAVGGLDVYVESDMQYYDFYAKLNIDLKQGFQRLSGKKADEYIRFRSDEMGDIGRIQRQQKLLKAFALETASFDTLWKLPNLTRIIQGSVRTDITLLESLQLASRLINLTPESVRTELLPGETVARGGMEYWQIDEEETQKLIVEMFYQQ